VQRVNNRIIGNGITTAIGCQSGMAGLIAMLRRVFLTAAFVLAARDRSWAAGIAWPTRADAAVDR
jgi:hypothetical protein